MKNTKKNPEPQPSRKHQARDWLEARIRATPPGGRLPSYRDIRGAIKFSQATLDAAIRELADLGMLEKRRGSGIYRTRAGQRVKTNCIGVVVPDIADPFSALILKGIEQRLARARRNMLVHAGAPNTHAGRDVIKMLHDKSDALIINPVTTNTQNPRYRNFYAGLINDGMRPAVVVDVKIPGIAGSFVGLDNYKAFFDFGVILRRQVAHQNIYFLGCMDSIPEMERWNGFCDGLADGGNPDQVEFVNIKTDNHIPIHLIARIRGNSGKHKVAPALICARPAALLPLLAVLQAHGIKIPANLEIFGVVEETTLPHLPAQMTVAVKPSVQLGVTAAETALRLVATTDKNNLTVNKTLQLEIKCITENSTNR